MKYQILVIAVAFGSLLAPPPALGQDFRNSPSLQGYTGLLNIPNAEVTEEGTIDLLYSDQVDPHRRGRFDSQDNQTFSIGVFSHFEGGMRHADPPGKGSDLSANFKVQVPWIPRRYPQLAFGVQDVAGGAPLLRTTYAVASHQLDLFRFTVGYGVGPDRMEGVFGGVEFRVAEWLYLIAEHDTDEAAAGLRLLTPPDLLPVVLGLTLRAPLKRADEFDFAVSMQIPLGRRDFSASKQLPPRTRSPAPPSVPSSVPEAPPTRKPGKISTPDQEIERELISLRKELGSLGFEDVRVGILDNEIFYFELENSRYNVNEVDGIGVALGTALERLPPRFTRFVLRLKNTNLPVLELSGPVGPFRAFFTQQAHELWDVSEVAFLREQFRVSNPGMRRPQGLVLLPGVENRQRGHSSLVLHPSVLTAVGTEVGAFDYRLSAKADLITRLWTGATLNARADIPVSWSEHFREGATFNRQGHNEPVVDRVFLSQAFRLAPGVTNQIGGGLFLEDLYGVLNETMWLPQQGSHRFRARLGRFEPKDGPPRDVWIGSYRYYMAPLDLYVEGSAGQFFNEDRGFQVEVKRFFGDTSVAAVFTETDERTIAFRITFPLTPRRDLRPGVLQVRGTERFGYQLSSVLAKEGGRNPTVFGIGEIPQTMVNLDRTLYNSDRLNSLYVNENLPRMREAYLRYGGK